MSMKPVKNSSNNNLRGRARISLGKDLRVIFLSQHQIGLFSDVYSYGELFGAVY